jgi:cytochrome P450
MGQGMLYNPASPEFAANCHEIFRVMRDEHPLYADPDGRSVALFRYDDVRSATLEWGSCSSTGTLEHHFAKPTMNSYDPPKHTQLRALISRAFTPRRIAEIEPNIRSIARLLLDDIDAGGTGVCDGINDFASLLPSMVIGKLIGLPDEVVPECRHLTDEFMRTTSVEAGANYPHMAYEIFAKLYDERRAHPQDDLMSALLVAEIDGERLTQDELLAFGWLLLVGGNDTTTNLIGNGLELFSRHPDQRAEMIAQPDAIAGAVDEVLRFASPSHSLPRTATRDIDHEHGHIPQGARVMLVWASANLDEREFDDPERFDIHRNASRHLALGHGVHYCLGASLTRLEARIAWEEFLARYPSYALATDPIHFTSSTFYGWDTLPLVLDP